MDLLRDYWWAIAIAVVVLVALVLLLRPKQRVTLTDSAPMRPHMQQPSATQQKLDSAGVAMPSSRAPAPDGDDLCKLKGVGPKFAEALQNAGISRFEQIAALSPEDVHRLDNQLGAFRGRLTRDRVAEQAEFLARDDTEGFEAKFGKL